MLVSVHQVRLHIWHYMRRISSKCNTGSQSLNAQFMRHLSSCIFQWSREDVDLLREATVSQDRPVGMTVKGRTVEWASFKDLALHCHRTTRPPEKIQRLIKDLLEVYSGQQDRDLLGTPVLDVDRGRDMWDSQKRHAVCIEDPPGVTLYTKTGPLKKGTVVLPTFRQRFLLPKALPPTPQPFHLR